MNVDAYRGRRRLLRATSSGTRRPHFGGRRAQEVPDRILHRQATAMGVGLPQPRGPRVRRTRRPRDRRPLVLATKQSGTARFVEQVASDRATGGLSIRNSTSA